MSCSNQNYIQENYSCQCCSNGKFVELKDTWTRNGSTQKTTWLPYNTRGKNIIKPINIIESYCSNCSGYSYAPNIFGGTISNTTPRNQTWKRAQITDHSTQNPLPTVNISSTKLIHNPDIYNIDATYHSSPSRNPMRYPMSYSAMNQESDNSSHGTSTAHYKEFKNIYCGV